MVATGQEGMEAITHISLSKNGKYLCMCERAPEGQKGKFSIFEVANCKYQKTLPENLNDLAVYSSQEFVASAFSPNDKDGNQIITLTG